MRDRELEKPKRGRGLKKKNLKKGIFLLPNLLTSMSLLGGFYAIMACIDGKYDHAAIAILISAVIDALDGRIARLTHTTSKFGAEYDSLADLVAFGLAPGVLIFTWALHSFGRYGWLAAFLYVVCGALRLARFNVQISTVESKRFNGLPIPAAAALIATTVLLFYSIGKGQDMAKHITVLLLIYGLAFLMISNVKFYSFKELDLKRRMPFSLLVGLIFLIVLITAEPPLMLFILFLGYALSGPIAWVLHWKKRQNHARSMADDDKSLFVKKEEDKN